ncbi:cytochrome c-type biogenesis protein CcmH [Gammaproteobacteria bacterium]|nr:cytochrome c-type biogenesis protein CcmH [Gammaproteobacteria bacterium]MDA8696311.1 cytochrome c-type biogenesis protein CcmH [Gammaproteobacteria bacterium]MDA8957653.1 cytochrome c-type biogenesis protein CcmH [Gammaproteobacteria bacterium]MDA9039187.1 cytochrome c-type biogenesis protein CcmH [Gammaproteobacteria bacterium]MDA9045112.1 cytochrome c-type biogenesis protein CcmH [Gammaproteobacteria bacterium]
MLNKFLFLFFISFTLLAESYYDFQNDEDEKRFFNLIKEIRCPKCTSGSLASSNAPVSEDLKKIIAEMIEDNKSNEDIKSYISDRFGKETLYDTPIEPKTYALWYSPFVFLLVCLMIFFFRKKA